MVMYVCTCNVACRTVVRACAALQVSFALKAERSDHVAFMMEKAPAVLIREAQLNPCGHELCDRVAALDAHMLTVVTRMSLGALMTLCGAGYRPERTGAAGWTDPFSTTSGEQRLSTQLESMGASLACRCNDTAMAYSCSCPSPPGGRARVTAVWGVTGQVSFKAPLSRTRFCAEHTRAHA
jgi:hypothetical protein|eukprot:SAG25_NODE_413_length_8292_cov_7.450629_3_plen_181_part_00